jgi:transaldolase
MAHGANARMTTTPNAVDTHNAIAAHDAQTNALVALVAEGQSIWLDFISRQLVRGGQLRRLIEQDGLRGMTSNPSIFQKAIAAGDAYAEQLVQLAAEGKTAGEIFEALSVQDVREACDLFRPLYDQSAGLDGVVSIEVAPSLAHDAQGTLVEAHRLWAAVDRPNVLIKVPGTEAGAAAAEQLLTEGVNVNITLLFSLRNYERVMQAYLSALEARVSRGLPIDRIASVASFFVSRVDTLVDRLLGERIEAAHLARDTARQRRLEELLGSAAIANAKLAYARFREVFGGERFARLAAHGASVQRPLWASTSVKNPTYRDVVYVEELIGPDTVNTVPLETISAFQAHGIVARSVDRRVAEARATLRALEEEAGLDFAAITQQLEDEGVALFVQSYDDLIAGVETKRRETRVTD